MVICFLYVINSVDEVEPALPKAIIIIMDQERMYMDDNVTVIRQMYAKFPLNKNKRDAVSCLKLIALICDLREHFWDRTIIN